MVTSVWVALQLAWPPFLFLAPLPAASPAQERGLDVLLLGLFLLTIATSSSSSLLLFSPLHAAALTLLSAVFSWELSTGWHAMATEERAHHILGLAGILLMSHQRIGGGMMVRLLLDTLTHFVEMLDSRRLFWLSFLALRVVGYPWVLLATLREAGDNHRLFSAVTACWLVFSSVYHAMWVYQERHEIILLLAPQRLQRN